jgi:hypothetical protein
MQTSLTGPHADNQANAPSNRHQSSRISLVRLASAPFPKPHHGAPPSAGFWADLFPREITSAASASPKGHDAID